MAHRPAPYCKIRHGILKPKANHKNCQALRPGASIFACLSLANTAEDFACAKHVQERCRESRLLLDSPCKGRTDFAHWLLRRTCPPDLQKSRLIHSHASHCITLSACILSKSCSCLARSSSGSTVRGFVGSISTRQQTTGAHTSTGERLSL